MKTLTKSKYLYAVVFAIVVVALFGFAHIAKADISDDAWYAGDYGTYYYPDAGWDAGDYGSYYYPEENYGWDAGDYGSYYYPEDYYGGSQEDYLAMDDCYYYGDCGYSNDYLAMEDDCYYFDCGYQSDYYQDYYPDDCCDYYPDDCCDYGYGGGYGNEYCCDYGGGSYYQPPRYNPPSYYQPPSTPSHNSSNSSSHSSANANASSNVVVHNNNTNNNTNVNNNNQNVVVNTGGSNDDDDDDDEDNDDLDVYCVGSPSNPETDEDVRWTAFASGGSGGYEYRWSGAVSGNNRTEEESYDDEGTETARIRVTDDDGEVATATCEVDVEDRNGSTISRVSVYSTPSGTPSSGVFLSQIPATGIHPALKLSLFILGLLMWSAFGAYMILEKRKMAALSTIGVETGEMEAEIEMEDEVMDTAPEMDSELDLESNLSFRAREKNVLISRDGLNAIIARANGNEGQANSILSEVIGKVSRNEGDYATLNSQKIDQLLS